MSRRHLWLAVRILVPIAAFTYLFSIVPLDELLPALRSIPLNAIAAALVMILLGTLAAAQRWYLLFAACGNTTTRPGVFELLRLHLIGAFYNTYVPGGLGGDIVRAAATRGVMKGGGFTGALAVILLERTLGLSGLLILVATTFTLFPLAGIDNVLGWSALGVGAAIAAVTGIVTGRRLAPLLPGPLGRIAQSLPTIVSAGPFVVALGLSVVTNIAVVFAGHTLLTSLTHEASLTDSLVILPLTSMTAYFPLTIGGAGVREGAFVLLYGLVGVSKSNAMATSVAFFGCMLAIAGIGGILHAVRPLANEVTDGVAPDRPSP